MDNGKILLPTGDYLRQLLGHPTISQSEVRKVARRRGIFTSSNDKKIIGPLLIKTGISPSEYSEIKASYRGKEENPKHKTRSISWSSEENLTDCLPTSLEYDSLIENQFGISKLVRPPEFATENSDPNHFSLDFEMSREDLTRNFGENITYHSGRVEFKRSDGEMQVTVAMTHTAPETRDFANNLVTEVIDHFKKEGHIAQDQEIRAIKFKDFTNEGRIKFLNELSQNAKYSVLTFVDTKNIRFRPDKTKSNPPEELMWMRDRIDDLKMKGKDLHATFFVNEYGYYSFIELFGLTCEYSYSVDGAAGRCQVQFEFTDSKESNETELTLKIQMFKFDNKSELSRPKAEKQILDSLEKYKLEVYNLHKKN
jgi:hypothetical protein